MRKMAINHLNLVTSTTNAARITAADTTFSAATAHADQVTVIGFQWISGTVTIGDSTVATGGVGAYVVLDTTTRVKEFRTNSNTATLPIRDFWCVGSGTFICYYQCQ